jgi:Uma2 family endonuclease
LQCIKSDTLTAVAVVTTVASMMQESLSERRCSRPEEAHAFRAERVELMRGQLVVSEPQTPYHASAVSSVDYALRDVLPPGWTVRLQAPVSLDGESELQPDLVVVPGRAADYRSAHPSHPTLVVEVAESSLVFDRERKGSLYARAGIERYWIVNLVERVLEAYGEPGPDGSAVYGWRYRSVTMLRPPDVAVPLACASRAIAVADLLP